MKTTARLSVTNHKLTDLVGSKYLTGFFSKLNTRNTRNRCVIFNDLKQKKTDGDTKPSLPLLPELTYLLYYVDTEYPGYEWNWSIQQGTRGRPNQRHQTSLERQSGNAGKVLACREAHKYVWGLTISKRTKHWHELSKTQNLRNVTLRFLLWWTVRVLSNMPIV